MTIVLSLIVGLLIGAFGIGGVLLVPILESVAGIPIRQAVSAAMFSYIFAGIVGTYMYQRYGSIDWTSVYSLSIGALPGALIGALLLPLIPKIAIQALIMSLILYSTLQIIKKSSAMKTNSSAVSNRKVYLYGIGFVTGVASTLSGTGGPLVVIPLLLMVGFLPHPAVGLAQAIQIPIAIVASGTYAYSGLLDYNLGIIIGMGSVAGVFAGSIIAHKIAPERFQGYLAVLLLGVAVFYGYFILQILI